MDDTSDMRAKKKVKLFSFYLTRQYEIIACDIIEKKKAANIILFFYGTKKKYIHTQLL